MNSEILLHKNKSNSRDLDEARQILAERGWVILNPKIVNGDPKATLLNFGKPVLQYNGQETFEVKYKPGYDDVPYSQSLNGIGAHTEAPAEELPPKYLALFCHRQATCGGGHTLLADGVAFYKTGLSADLRAWADQNEVAFGAATKPGSAKRWEWRAPILCTVKDDFILRFSYNLFRYGDANPSEFIVNNSPFKKTPLTRIAEQGERYFYENKISVLIPEKSILIWNNHKFLHGRGQFSDPKRHLTRYWLSE